MLNYELKVFPKRDENGKTYWTALFPRINGCVGGGDTPEEAIKAAEENLEIYIEFLQETGAELPEEYEETHYSGKIALRTTKRNHQRLAEISSKEGMSINFVLNMAVEQYLAIYDHETNSPEVVIDKTQSPILLLDTTDADRYSVIEYDYNVNDEMINGKAKIINFPRIFKLETLKEN